jgi:hypothetical protein
MANVLGPPVRLELTKTTTFIPAKDGQLKAAASEMKSTPYPALRKADVVKAWRPHMRALGFVYQDNAFTFKETMGQPFQLVVGVQKNLHSDTYQIPVQIVIASPFAQSRRQVFIQCARRTIGQRGQFA